MPNVLQISGKVPDGAREIVKVCVTHHTSHNTHHTLQIMHKLDTFRMNGKFQLLMQVEGRVQVTLSLPLRMSRWITQ